MAALIPLANQILQYERCSSIPIGTDGANDWQCKYVNAEPSQMIRTIQVSSDEELHEAIEEGMSTTCRRENLPWWEFVRIENSNGDSVVMIRVDHWIGDGLSLVTLMEQILTLADGVTPIPPIIPESMSNKFKRKLGLVTKISMFFKAIYFFIVVLALPTGKYDDDTHFGKSMNSKMIYTWKVSERTCRCPLIWTVPKQPPHTKKDAPVQTQATTKLN